MSPKCRIDLRLEGYFNESLRSSEVDVVLLLDDSDDSDPYRDLPIGKEGSFLFHVNLYDAAAVSVLYSARQNAGWLVVNVLISQRD